MLRRECHEQVTVDLSQAQGLLFIKNMNKTKKKRECWLAGQPDASQPLHSMRVFNFKELVPNGHVTVTEDGMLYAVELVMVVNGCNRVAANHTLSRVKEEHFSCSKLSIKKMRGKGNGHCKLVTFENAIELLMALPGEGAKEYRSKFADVIKRYLAGDQTLIVIPHDEIVTLCHNLHIPANHLVVRDKGRTH